MPNDYNKSNAAASDSGSSHDQNKHYMTSITDMKFLQPNDATSIITDTLRDKAKASSGDVDLNSNLDVHSSIHTDLKVLEGAQPTAFNIQSTKHVGRTLGFFTPISLGLCISLWLFYAYRNPHSKSGQLLIQVSAFIHI